MSDKLDNDEPAVQRIVETLRTLQISMNDEQRLELWRVLRDGYCGDCGCEDLNGHCQCWNDE